MRSLKCSVVLWTLFVLFVSQNTGLVFNMYRSQTSHYCGRLQCISDSFTLSANNILAIYGLTIYDVTQTNVMDKLASVSVYDADLVLSENSVRIFQATGSVSKTQADLNIYFATEFDCLYGSFLCELDFVNTSGMAGTVSQRVYPGITVNDVTILNMFATIGAQIKTYGDNMDSQLAALRRQNNDLVTQMNALEQRLGTGSAQQPALQTTCVRNMVRKKPMEKMLLWGTIETWCDTETDDGGWIVIQRRSSGDVNFVRKWESYKNGFGTADTDFWIGNDAIHNLTSQGYNQLRIEMKNPFGTKYYAGYNWFYVSDEVSNYQLTVNGYYGYAGDSLAYHNGSYFSTADRDNDLLIWSNCASGWGGWWYKGGPSSPNYSDCSRAHLNGLWQYNPPAGIFWNGISNTTYLTFSEMKVRRY